MSSDVSIVADRAQDQDGHPRGAGPGSVPFSNEEFRELYPRLRRFAAVVGDADMDPDDLVQDALFGFLRLRDAQVHDVGIYLRRSIVNAVAHERRRSQRARELRRSLRGVPDSDTPTYPSEVRTILSAVRSSDRGLIYLVDIEGLSMDSASEILGLSAVAARARASRARRAARQALGRE